MIRTLKNLYHFISSFFAAVYYRFPSRHLTVIGVTGTDGKTTTSTLIYHLLKTGNKKTALISTVAAYIGDKQIDTGFHVTSPNAWQLQRLIKEIADSGFDHLVLEVTSHGLDQHRFLGTHFDIGVLTNITPEHLDYHPSFDHYLATKAKLFRSISLAVLNQTDSSYQKIKSNLSPQTQILAYHSSILNSKLDQTVKSQFKQTYNQLNATAAILVAQHLDIPDNTIMAAISSFPGIPGRMQSIKNTHNINAFVDFAHTPNSLKNVLTQMRKQTKGKLIAIYGAAGLRDHHKRPVMGKIGSELADEVILTAEDPRTESVWSILDQMTSTITQNIGHVFKIPDRAQAIRFGVQIAKPGDTLLLLGKGHEQSMCFGTIERPWSDTQQLKRELKQKHG